MVSRADLQRTVFQPYKDLSDITKAAFLCDPEITRSLFAFDGTGRRAGSADTVRDITRFCDQIYTEGEFFDLVGNNTPIFLSGCA